MRELPPAFHNGVEDVWILSPRCPQDGWTPLRKPGTIVDMTTVFGVFAAAAVPTAPPVDPQHLPLLPPQGLVVSQGRAVTFVDLRGRALGRVEGFRFASENTFGAGVPRFTDTAGRLWRLDRTRRRFVSASAGQLLYGGATITFVSRPRSWLVRARAGHTLLRMRVQPDARGALFDISEGRDVVTTRGRAFDLRSGTSVRMPPLCFVGSGTRPRWILLCGSRRYQSTSPRTIEELADGRRRVIARPPGKQPAPNTPPVGHWAGVRVSPDGRMLLAQWSAECETPQAFVVARTGRSLVRIGGAAEESIALGWTRDGLPVVYFPSGVCGGTYRLGAGVYALGPKKPRLIMKATPRLSVAMWG